MGAAAWRICGFRRVGDFLSAQSAGCPDGTPLDRPRPAFVCQRNRGGLDLPGERRGGRIGSKFQPLRLTESPKPPFLGALPAYGSPDRSLALGPALHISCHFIFVADPSGTSLGPGFRLVDRFSLSPPGSPDHARNLPRSDSHRRTAGSRCARFRAGRCGREYFRARQCDSSQVDGNLHPPFSDYPGYASHPSFRRVCGTEHELRRGVFLVGPAVWNLPPGSRRRPSAYGRGDA